jgi:uncharacterized protein YdhG (YjbR/CyaY superfamily)
MSVIDDYLNKVEAPQKAALERVRKIIKQISPNAEEVITYGMPGFKYKGKYLIAFAPFKNHMSIFPGAEAVEITKADLGNHTLSKGTIQFTIDSPLSEALIKKVVTVRMKAIDKK